MADPRDMLQLVLLAQCDDRDAIEALFVRVQASLLRYIAGLVGASAAEDVLQDVFVKLWRNLKWLDRPELFLPWAYRIASRTCFSCLKRDRRWAEHCDNQAVVEDLAAPDNPEFPEPLPDLGPLLDRVSPASRAVLLLHYGQDLTLQEVAAILEIDLGTAKSRLAYGLACLRNTIERKTKHDVRTFN
jgi:RNA polymerase sigma-70 factor (ECF subfamily)